MTSHDEERGVWAACAPTFVLGIFSGSTPSPKVKTRGFLALGDGDEPQLKAAAEKKENTLKATPRRKEGGWLVNRVAAPRRKERGQTPV